MCFWWWVAFNSSLVSSSSTSAKISTSSSRSTLMIKEGLIVLNLRVLFFFIMDRMFTIQTLYSLFSPRHTSQLECFCFSSLICAYILIMSCHRTLWCITFWDGWVDPLTLLFTCTTLWSLCLIFWALNFSSLYQWNFFVSV